MLSVRMYIQIGWLGNKNRKKNPPTVKFEIDEHLVGVRS